jgi:hypothetical protein
MSGTTRIQTGRLADLGNVRVVGMDVNDVPGLFKMRKVSDTIVYFWPQDIIDETIKAYSTSATTATGYGSSDRRRDGTSRPRTRRSASRRSTTTTATAASRQLVVTGPMFLSFDLSVRKRIAISKVTYEFSLDIFNVLNHVNWNPPSASATRRWRTGRRACQATGGRCRSAPDLPGNGRRIGLTQGRAACGPPFFSSPPRRPGRRMTTPEVSNDDAAEHPDVLRPAAASWRARDATALAAGHAVDGRVSSPMWRERLGRDAILESYRQLFETFPDWEFNGHQLLDRRRPRGAAVFGDRHARGRVHGPAAYASPLPDRRRAPL